LMVFLLVIHFRCFYGVFLPLLGIVLSSIWGLGFISLLKWNLDPLNLVIPFLIAARAMSHSIQLVERYYGELAVTLDSKQAARNAFDDLFRPGSLAIVVDAVGILVIALGAAPINIKLGYYAGFWAFSVIFTVLLVVPLLLLLGFSAVAVMPVSMALVQESFPQDRALANGIYMAINFLVQALGVLLLGAMADRLGLRSAFTISAAVILLGLPIIFLLPKRGTPKIA